MRTKEKALKDEAKLARAEKVRSRKKHNEFWRAKNVRALGDKLHAAIRENAPVLEGYKAPYCGIIPQVCKDNQRLAGERRRRRKNREDASSLPALQEVKPMLMSGSSFQHAAYYYPPMRAGASFQYAGSPSTVTPIGSMTTATTSQYQQS